MGRHEDNGEAGEGQQFPEISGIYYFHEEKEKRVQICLQLLPRRPLVICPNGHSVCHHCSQTLRLCPQCRFVSFHSFRPPSLASRHPPLLVLQVRMSQAAHHKHLSAEAAGESGQPQGTGRRKPLLLLLFLLLLQDMHNLTTTPTVTCRC